jgi:thiamine kinase-like enzyme
MDIENVLSNFKIEGKLISTKSNRVGHINTTFMSCFDDDGVINKYTHQKINRVAFHRPDEVMENIVSVTEHIQDKVKDFDDRDKRCLQVVMAKDGKPYYVDEDGEYYRTYKFIDDVRTYQTIDGCDSAYHLGEAIATFQDQLSDFDGTVLNETIKDFHNMHFRYDNLKRAVEQNCCNRLSLVEDELSYLFENEERGYILWDSMVSERVPLRVTHNDTKINNVLFSNSDSKEALCVIDLDTVMPGTILFDTGDMIRTATSTVEEDSESFEDMQCNLEYFRSLIEGYLSIADSYLTDNERELIVESGRNITQIMAVRFLTDYLAGDVYYSIERENHNLDRCRTQIAFMKDYDEKWDQLLSVIK